MDTIISKMTSNTYKILKQMNNYQVYLPDGTCYVPLSQAELSKILGVSTITMNKLFKQMREDGLVNPLEGVRGKYQLTQRARIIIEKMEELENELSEAER